MNKFAMLAAVGAAGFVLAGCDSKAENEVEAQATAIDESYEAEADLQDALAESAPNEDELHDQADATREKGEEIKDHLEDEADELDDAPQ